MQVLLYVFIFVLGILVFSVFDIVKHYFRENIRYGVEHWEGTKKITERYSNPFSAAIRYLKLHNSKNKYIKFYIMTYDKKRNLRIRSRQSVL